MVDDRTHTVYSFTNYTDPDSLDVVLEPEKLGRSSLAATALANGTVLAVWAQCHLALIDYGNGWWAIYLHLANILVSSGDSVTANTMIGYPTTNVMPSITCGRETSDAEHVHFALLNGSGVTGAYVSMLGTKLCGHTVAEVNNDPTDIILQGLTTTKDQVFTVPQCSSSAAHSMLYGGSEDFNIYAVDTTTHTFRWSYLTGSYVYTTPAVAGGVVYVGADDSYLYALNAADGTLKWRYKTGSGVESSPTVLNGIVYFGSNDFYVYALNASTGALVWRYKTNGEVESRPTIVNGVIYVGAGYPDSSVYALNLSDGTLLWSYHTGDYIYSSATVVNGVLYIGSNDSYVYALYASSGALVWRYKTGSFIRSTPAVANGVVYVDSFDGYLYALTADNGTLLWRVPGGQDSRIEPAVVNGIVYTRYGAYYASTGVLIWKTVDAFSEPIVVNGIVYVGTTSGFAALNSENGSEYWRTLGVGAIFSSPTLVL
jgi:outer membrane protein assembly factor BamB